MDYDSVESDTQQRNDRRPAYQPTAATLATTDAQRDYPTVAPLGKAKADTMQDGLTAVPLGTLPTDARRASPTAAARAR